MLCSKLFLEVSEGLINEVRPSITYHHPRCPKTRKDDFLESVAQHGTASTT
jgi:hypothetical protein